MTTDQPYSRLDYAFAQFLAQRAALDSKQKKDFEALCIRLSYQQSQGHNCIHIDEVEQQLVQASGLISLSKGKISPLVLEQNRLYLYRYWHYENRLASQLMQLVSRSYSDTKFDSIVNRYFIQLIDETDWQRAAAKKAVSQAFSIITGGPGTGKTSTIIKILAILQELNGNSLRIALAAPTGKAAMRLQQSIGLSKNALPCSEAIKNKIPDSVYTLHHLLGARPHSVYFKHDSTYPLVYDLVVVDEASMIDLALMSKLVDALKPSSRLILLGDKDQLASVESGAVLADLTTGLPEYTLELKKSYRFQGEIKKLADAVNQQSVEEAWQLLNNHHNQIGLLNENLIEYIVKQYNHYFQLVNSDADFKSIIHAFTEFQVLCSNRQGEKGVININDQVEQQLVKQKAIQTQGKWYAGRPIMITQNNSAMQLYNGDIGVCLSDRETGKLTVFFQGSNGNIKKVFPSRLPTHETVFAMTIHKSQGSEFDQCLCVLAEKTNAVLSKELIYTAITRAKSKLKIASDYAVFYQALENKIERSGGLFEKLTQL